jgi:hypothetical protein
MRSTSVKKLVQNSLYFRRSKKDKSAKKNQTLKLYTIHYTYIYVFVIFAEPKI